MTRRASPFGGLEPNKSEPSSFLGPGKGQGPLSNGILIVLTGKRKRKFAKSSFFFGISCDWQVVTILFRVDGAAATNQEA